MSDLAQSRVYAAVDADGCLFGSVACSYDRREVAGLVAKWIRAGNLVLCVGAEELERLPRRADGLGEWQKPPVFMSVSAMQWRSPKRNEPQCWSLFDGARVVARVERNGGSKGDCEASVDGWLWRDRVTGGLTQRRSFQNVWDARSAVHSVLKGLSREKR